MSLYLAALEGGFSLDLDKFTLPGAEAPGVTHTRCNEVVDRVGPFRATAHFRTDSAGSIGPAWMGQSGVVVTAHPCDASDPSTGDHEDLGRHRSCKH